MLSQHIWLCVLIVVSVQLMQTAGVGEADNESSNVPQAPALVDPVTMPPESSEEDRSTEEKPTKAKVKDGESMKKGNVKVTERQHGSSSKAEDVSKHSKEDPIEPVKADKGDTSGSNSKKRESKIRKRKPLKVVHKAVILTEDGAETDQDIDKRVVTEAESLRAAMKGWGTNERLLVDVSTKLTYRERQRVISVYSEKIHRDLIDDLKKETSGDFGRLIVGLYQPRENFLASEMKAAIVGLGTDESTINEIMCCLSQSLLQKITKAYSQVLGRSLESDIHGDTSGQYRSFLKRLLLHGRQDDMDFDDDQVESMMKMLNPGLPKAKKGHSKETTKEYTNDEDDSDPFYFDLEAFQTFLANSSFPFIKEVARQFEQTVGHDMQEVIQSATTADLQHLMLDILHFAQNGADFYARKINAGLNKPFLVNKRSLTRVLVTSSHQELTQIRQVYNTLFQNKLEWIIGAKTKGDYKNAALIMIQKGGQ